MAKKDNAEDVAVEAQAPAELITVRSNLKPNPDGGVPVALWEQDPQHPDGEVYIAGDKPVEVAQTGAVLKALSEDRIVKVSASEARAASKPEEKK